jgi:hypothetical protein
MIKCEPFCGKPGSGVAGCQPFEMKMHSNVLIAMDFHAHLMTTEVIGFLAGQWNKEKKRTYAFLLKKLKKKNTHADINLSPVRHACSGSLSMPLLKYRTK